MPDIAVDPRQFRDALGSFTTGVTVVTTRDPAGVDVGITANSFNSVSLDPPMVLWSLAKASRNLPAFMASDYFAVHVLSAEQDALSTQFATSGAQKFANLEITRGIGDAPLLSGCAARFQCRTAFRYEGGDHVIFVGKVEEFDHSDHPPLVYHGGRYALAIKREHPNALDLGNEPDSSFSQNFLVYLLGRAHHHLFLDLRRELERFGLSEDGWFVLSLLGVSEHRCLAELNRLLSYTGKKISHELVTDLMTNGFVRLHGAYDPQATITLTELGQQTVIELMSAGKAAEDHATRNLEISEQYLLKQALRRLIRDTSRE